MEQERWRKIKDGHLIRFMQECLETYGESILEVEPELMTAEDGEAMDEMQKTIIKSNDRSFSRIKYKLYDKG